MLDARCALTRGRATRKAVAVLAQPLCCPATGTKQAMHLTPRTPHTAAAEMRDTPCTALDPLPAGVPARGCHLNRWLTPVSSARRSVSLCARVFLACAWSPIRRCDEHSSCRGHCACQGGAFQQRHPAGRRDGAADVRRRRGRREPDHPGVHAPRVQPKPGRARDGDPGAALWLRPIFDQLPAQSICCKHLATLVFGSRRLASVFIKVETWSAGTREAPIQSDPVARLYQSFVAAGCIEIADHDCAQHCTADHHRQAFI